MKGVPAIFWLLACALSALASDARRPDRRSETSAPGDWAFQPIQRPALPSVQRSGRAQNPIDLFILAKLEAHGLAPAPEADRRTLVRRLSFDLTGLPPEPREVEAFLSDRAPHAWSRLVERYLSSPHFGE